MSKDALKITLLVDNEAAEGLEKEHGFAAWIEAGDRRILFDTGHHGAMQINAKKLGVDLTEADTLIISHGHRDHTGTMAEFLAENDKAEIYFANEIEFERYWYTPDANEYSMPNAAKEAMAELPESRKHSLKTAHYLAPGIGLTGPVPRLNNFEDTGGIFHLDAEKGDVDHIEDDQSMWFETDDGLVILLGCCHSGLDNTINHIRKMSGMEKVKGVIGGMHLLQASDERLNKTFDILSSWKTDYLIPCHCTGMASAIKMREAIGDETVKHGHAGMVIDAGFLR